jgi:hypothetical protein
MQKEILARMHGRCRGKVLTCDKMAKTQQQMQAVPGTKMASRNAVLITGQGHPTGEMSPEKFKSCLLQAQRTCGREVIAASFQ